MRRKILIVTPSFAAYAFLKSMCQEYMRRGYEVHFVSSDFGFHNDTNIPKAMTLHNVKMARGSNLFHHIAAAKSLDAIISAVQPDILDIHYSAALVTFSFCKTRNMPPAIGTIQGLRFTHLTGVVGFIAKFIELRACKKMSHVNVLTNDDLEALHTNGVLNAGIRYQSGFGCDLDAYDPTRFSQKERLTIRNRIGVSPDAFVVVFAGRFAKFKGFDIVVESFQKCLSKIDKKYQKRLTLVLCGAFDVLHESGLSEAEVDKLGEHNQIINLGWVDDTSEILSISNVCVFPSEREGMAVNLMESLAMGVPVITTSARGCGDVVRNRVDGVVLELSSVDSFCDALLELVSDEGCLVNYSIEALRGRDRFQRSNFVNAHIDFILSSVD